MLGFIVIFVLYQRFSLRSATRPTRRGGLAADLGRDELPVASRQKLQVTASRNAGLCRVSLRSPLTFGCVVAFVVVLEFEADVRHAGN